MRNGWGDFTLDRSMHGGEPSLDKLNKEAKTSSCVSSSFKAASSSDDRQFAKSVFEIAASDLKRGET